MRNFRDVNRLNKDNGFSLQFPNNINVNLCVKTLIQ